MNLGSGWCRGGGFGIWPGPAGPGDDWVEADGDAGTDGERERDAEEELAVNVALSGFFGSVEMGGQCVNSDYQNSARYH